MSAVTNTILSCFCSENLEAFQEYMKEYPDKRHSRFIAVDREKVGGTKCLETELLIAAFNHLDTKEFIDYVFMFPWEYPEEVQLLLKGEDDELFISHSMLDWCRQV